VERAVVEIDESWVPEDRIDKETGKLKVPAVYFDCQDPYEIMKTIGSKDLCLPCGAYQFPDSSKTECLDIPDCAPFGIIKENG